LPAGAGFGDRGMGCSQGGVANSGVVARLAGRTRGAPGEIVSGEIPNAAAGGWTRCGASETIGGVRRVTRRAEPLSRSGG
jgi:hypothetical protein